MQFKDVDDWAEQTFGKADLNDKRRTRRLVKIASDLACNAGESLVKASGDEASIEGAYRFIRNDQIHAEDIAQAGFEATLKCVSQRDLVLAIEDTTGLSFRHSITKDLGSVSCTNKGKCNDKGRSLFVHSTLMMDAITEQTLGLSNQDCWIRTVKKPLKKRQRQQQDLKQKESYKWQRSAEQVPSEYNNIIHVCDREADMFEYCAYQIERNGRFLVRASQNRRLASHEDRLYKVAKSLEPQGSYEVNIPQKGGRKARKAHVDIAYTNIEMMVPGLLSGQPLQLNLLVGKESNSPAEVTPLNWLLLTTESLTNIQEARKLIRYYELRWRIEDFHKVWKSGGTQVEKLRMQTRENMERMAVILAFIAVRLMQLKEIITTDSSEQSCIHYFSATEWRLMWKKVEKKALPNDPPTVHWAYYALAKLGGWHDSKRTGIVGLKA